MYVAVEISVLQNSELLADAAKYSDATLKDATRFNVELFLISCKYARTE
jgi:hypothetical protein